ncbi:hypothetical protein QZH41_000765 [Actinostola sp. cb2023]|nr:hypothetical protein QZH41_000765 [Actinostola sp. cb2023]
MELNHFQTTFDDKSGYDHVRLYPASATFFGLEWKGWYFAYATLPFGWKASAYLYHSIGLAATHLIRSSGVPCSQYIDDRHVGQLRMPPDVKHAIPNFQLAEMAAFIACSTLISLGYFIGLHKSTLSPTVAVRFLGYICDSEKQAFILPKDKRIKFASLRDSILSKKTVSLKNLQKFAGKTTSFSLLVPAAKLFSNAAYQAISRAHRSSTRQITISTCLRNELLHWKFLDSWSGFLPWKSEKHFCISLFSDASHSGWGGCLTTPGQSAKESRGYWDEETRAQPIAVKEALALLRTLESLSGDTSNARIDAFVDNKVLLDSWIQQTSRSPAITTVMKQLFSFTMSRNLALVMHLVPSRANLADDLSRVVSDLDCTLSLTTWRQIDVTFGPHSIDMMALPSNVRTDRAGRPLRFFSQLPCPESEGTNVFAQNIAEHENCYVFPPFSLIAPLLKHLQSQGCPVSIVVPDLTPRKYWWPLICRRASSSFMLGSKGTSNVLLFPAKTRANPWTPRPLQWDLWVFRLPPSQY